MNELLLILLQQEAAQEGGSAWSGMIMILAMIVIFYFFMIRPQSKKQKELKKAREAMKKGDKVVSAGGIHGRIKDLSDTWVMMEIAPSVTIKIDKASVFALVEGNDQKKEQSSKKLVKEDVPGAGIELEKASGKVTK